MAIEDIKHVRKVTGEIQAQKLLDDGWVILVVCVCQEGLSQYAEYHMCKADAIGLSDHPSLSGDAKT
ncbi:hypothetical protein V2L00_08675 [Pseudomonas alliivorans]|nr:hypothetical protein [Pseudomonas alliivorans]